MQNRCIFSNHIDDVTFTTPKMVQNSSPCSHWIQPFDPT
jgi:hypothetical protein